MARTLETDIDALYKLPPAEFTAARNALAQRAGSEAERVRSLTKPPLAAWAVNQLYWTKRELWDRLTAAAENARRTHKRVLSGGSGDIRAVTREHDDAVEGATKATLALLENAGHPVSDATRQAVITTLRALPGGAAPGRLSHTLQPGGFEALAGLSIGRRAAPAREKPLDRKPARKASALSKTEAAALARAREALAAAERALREAEHGVQREEFELAKSVREETRAREAVERSKAELEEAEATLKRVGQGRAAAERRTSDAREALRSSQARAEAAAEHVRNKE